MVGTMNHADILDRNSPEKANPAPMNVAADSLWNIFHRQPTAAVKNAAAARSEVARLPLARIVGLVA